MAEQNSDPKVIERNKRNLKISLTFALIFYFAIIPFAIFEMINFIIVLCVLFLISISFVFYFWYKLPKKPKVEKELVIDDIRTAEGMLNYTKINRFFVGYNFWQKNHFKKFTIR